ncbi:hypothetical protein DPMN_063682 [Dreissena polymorpha]|uniref:Uncharacterized protein n=1 Tax=Dreissena polymorpha TaxID=45954 RepID=A0A9D4CC66_DREPO|nr:hypothetical protein DPMN_063682 [Dreissena polymorpha]
MLWAIAFLIEGTDLKTILETFHGENAIVHIMTGKAVQRNFRVNFRVDKCLRNQFISGRS